jgi:hypothetical protein
VTTECEAEVRKLAWPKTKYSVAKIRTWNRYGVLLPAGGFWEFTI